MEDHFEKVTAREFDKATPESPVYQSEYSDEPSTKQDFLDLVNGDEVAARNLFDCCEWQHPATLIDEGGSIAFFKGASDAIIDDGEVSDMAEAAKQQDGAFIARAKAISDHARTLSRFVPESQLKTIFNLAGGEEGQYFKDKLDEIHRLVDSMPKTYGQDGLGDDAIAYMHYFIGGANWYITERDMEDEQHQAFGLADLFGDGGEIGYISIEELKSVGAELDLYWNPVTIGEIKAQQSPAEKPKM